MSRPKIENRVKLTTSEQKYCKLRSSGMSITEAAVSIGRRPAEMSNLEKRWPLIGLEIQKERREELTVTFDQSNAVRVKVLQDLHKNVSDLLVKGKLNITETARAYDLLRSMESDLTSILQQSKAEQAEASDEFGGMTDFPNFLKRVKSLAARELAKTGCPSCGKKFLLAKEEKEHKI